MASKNYENHELLFGIHPVVELLKARRRSIFAVYTTDPAPKAWGSIAQLLPAHVPVKRVTKEQLTHRAGTADHQGVVALVAPFPFRKKMFDAAQAPFLILLDGIQDPRNVGAILRSAYCTGVDGVIVCAKHGAPLNAVALKSAAGLAEHLEIYQAPNATVAAQELTRAGYTIYLADFGGKDAREQQFAKPLCLVIGSEGLGVSAALRTKGTAVTLAQRSADISYNASVAAGILLFTIASLHKKI